MVEPDIRVDATGSATRLGDRRDYLRSVRCVTGMADGGCDVSFWSSKPRRLRCRQIPSDHGSSTMVRCCACLLCRADGSCRHYFTHECLRTQSSRNKVIRTRLQGDGTTTLRPNGHFDRLPNGAHKEGNR